MNDEMSYTRTQLDLSHTEYPKEFFFFDMIDDIHFRIV